MNCPNRLWQAISLFLTIIFFLIYTVTQMAHFLKPCVESQLSQTHRAIVAVFLASFSAGLFREELPSQKIPANTGVPEELILHTEKHVFLASVLIIYNRKCIYLPKPNSPEFKPTLLPGVP